MWGQILTLAGVALGATGSFIATRLLERERSRRHLALRWDVVTHQAFADYLKAVVGMARMAGQAARNYGWDSNAAQRDLDEALGLLEEREDERTVAFERLRLVADAETIGAANLLNAAVWRLEWLATGRDAGSTSQWKTARAAYLAALDEFHAATRARLSMLVPDVDPRVVADTHPPLPISDPDAAA